jgi:hypothetical protein
MILEVLIHNQVATGLCVWGKGSSSQWEQVAEQSIWSQARKQEETERLGSHSLQWLEDLPLGPTSQMFHSPPEVAT